MEQRNLLSLNTWLFTSLSCRNTGLSFEINIVAGSYSKDLDIPVVLIGKEYSSLMTVYDEPTIIEGSIENLEDYEKIQTYIKTNRKPILDHWYGKICSIELCERLTKPIKTGNP